jgi:hypothetical protein
MNTYCFLGVCKIDALVRFINEFKDSTGIPLDQYILEKNDVWYYGHDENWIF